MIFPGMIMFFRPGQPASGIEIFLAIAYHVFWMFWILHWFLEFDETCFENFRTFSNPILALYALFFKFVAGVGLTKKGRRVRNMIGLGLIGLFVPAAILFAISRIPRVR